MAYIVQKLDMMNNCVDLLVSQEGYPAHQYYKQIEKQMGASGVRIMQR